MSQVIINDIPPYTQATAILNQTVFGTNWTANFASDVVVYVTPFGDDPDDFTQILSYPSQYSVDFIGALQEVQVTLVTPSAAGDIVTITRMTPADRENLYTNTNFTPSMLNNDFGILTLVDQQAQLVNQRIAPRYNYSATIVDVLDTILPILPANSFWAKNAAGTAIEAFDISTVISGGTVTQINTGLGLTGGPITSAGTISFATMPANTFWGNITGSVALPTQVPTSYFLISSNNFSDVPNKPLALSNLGAQAGSPALTSIAGLTTVANNMLYTTASNTYAVIAPQGDSSLVSSFAGVPSWSQTLPQSVQTNITLLGVQNQPLNMGGFQINNGADPTQPSDFATKNYVDLNALTGTSVYAASTTNLTVTQAGSGVGATLTNAGALATFSLDGVNPPLNSNVLIKNLAAPQNEGIYTVTNVGSGATNWILTRATTYDTPAEINHTGLIVVQNGSTLAGTAWYNAATIVTVDTTPFSYSQFGNITFPVSLAHGGTNANLTASNGGIFYSTSTAGAILSGVATAGKVLQSGATAAPTWSTPTYPSASGTAGQIIRSDGTNNVYSTSTFADTYSASNLLYSNGANTVTGLATTNNGVLVTNGSGVPSISTTLPSGIAATNMVLTTPRIGTIADTNGVAILTLTPTASAVNNFKITNSATLGALSLSAIGTDTDISMAITAKGAGVVAIQGAAGSTSPVVFYNGTTLQHATTFSFSNTAASRTVTFPDATGTVVLAASGQVIQSVNTFVAGSSTTSTSFVDVTSASLSITPTSASSTVLVLMNWGVSITAVAATNTTVQTQVLRGATVIPTGAAQTYGANSGAGGLGLTVTGSYMYVDSPATTSSTTYKLQHKSSVGTATASSLNVTIILMELHS